MKPITTPETNITYTAEGDEDESILPLPAVVRDHGILRGIFSTWELTPEERMMIAEGANIELGVVAAQPPPASLAVAAPFEGEKLMVWSDELKTFVCPQDEQ